MAKLDPSKLRNDAWVYERIGKCVKAEADFWAPPYENNEVCVAALVCPNWENRSQDTIRVVVAGADDFAYAYGKPISEFSFEEAKALADHIANRKVISMAYLKKMGFTFW